MVDSLYNKMWASVWAQENGRTGAQKAGGPWITTIYKWRSRILLIRMTPENFLEQSIHKTHLWSFSSGNLPAQPLREPDFFCSKHSKNFICFKIENLQCCWRDLTFIWTCDLFWCKQQVFLTTEYFYLCFPFCWNLFIFFSIFVSQDTTCTYKNFNGPFWQVELCFGCHETQDVGEARGGL